MIWVAVSNIVSGSPPGKNWPTSDGELFDGFFWGKKSRFETTFSSSLKV